MSVDFCDKQLIELGLNSLQAVHFEYQMHSDRANQRKTQSIFGAKSVLKQANRPVIDQGPLKIQGFPIITFKGFCPKE